MDKDDMGEWQVRLDSWTLDLSWQHLWSQVWDRCGYEVFSELNFRT